jgi:hypothetical protein
MPTAAAATTVLPAPLLFISEAGQLARLAPDATVVTALSEENNPVFDFAIASDGNTIAYLTIAESGNTTLVRINGDGAGRIELASGVIRGVSVGADGSVQAGALFETSSADGSPLQAGTWSFPAGGGAPSLLAAATEPVSSDGETTPGVHYQPLAWAPDGELLLLRLTMNMGPDGPAGDIGATGLALYETSSGATLDLLPLGSEPLCAQPVWSAAGDAILCANAGAVGPPTPALWRLNLATGAEQTIIPAGEPVDLVFSPRELADDVSYLAGVSATAPLRLMPQRIRPDGTVEALLPQPVEAGYDGGLWAPDGSGIVVGRPSASANRTIVWQPVDGGSPVELLNGNIGKLEWASP